MVWPTDLSPGAKVLNCVSDWEEASGAAGQWTAGGRDSSEVRDTEQGHADSGEDFGGYFESPREPWENSEQERDRI